MSKERAVVLRTMAEVAAQMVVQGDWQDEALAAEATAFAHWLNEEARALGAPRTPETVLRAMLKAYEAAAIDQEIAEHVRNPVRVYAILNDYESDIGGIRRMLANCIANGVVPDRADWNGRLVTDYEMRLSGARPLDAPPLEES